MNPNHGANTSRLLRGLTAADDAVRVRSLATLAAQNWPADPDCIGPIGIILTGEFDSTREPRHAVVRDAVGLLRSAGPAAAPILIACVEQALRADPGDEEAEQLADDMTPVFEALAELLPGSPNAIVSALELLDDDYPDPFRVQVTVCLSRCGSAAEEIVPALVELGRCQVKTSPLFDAVRFALHAIGPAAVAPLVGVLSGLPVTDDDSHRCFAAIMLGDFSLPEYPAPSDAGLARASRTAIPALISALSAGGPSLRLAATHALGRMGPPANDAVPALTAVLHECNHLQRQSAMRALELIDDKRRSTV